MTEDKADQKKIDRLTRLFVVLMELEGKRREVLEEMERILAGKPGVNEHLKTVMGAWNGLWRTRYSANYAWRQTEDVPQIKRLMKLLGETMEQGAAELVKRANAYIRSDDPYHKMVRHKFAIFVANINDFADDALPLGDDDHAAAVGCGHTPACRNDDEHTRRKMREMRA